VLECKAALADRINLVRLAAGVIDKGTTLGAAHEAPRDDHEGLSPDLGGPLIMRTVLSLTIATYALLFIQRQAPHVIAQPQG
jgi:hypothetical protein